MELEGEPADLLTKKIKALNGNCPLSLKNLYPQINVKLYPRMKQGRNTLSNLSLCTRCAM